MPATPAGPPMTESERLERELKQRNAKEAKQLADNAKAASHQAMQDQHERAQPLEHGEPVEVMSMSIKPDSPIYAAGKLLTFVRATDGYAMHVMANRTIRVMKEGAREITFVPFGNIASFTIKLSA